MAKTDTTTTRSPRGAKPVSQAFLTALDTIPEASRSAVARAAQAMIREELKAQRDRIKAAAVKHKAVAAKEKARAPGKDKAGATKPSVVARVTKKKTSSSSGTAPEVAALKRRGRKPVETPIVA
jgi:hypothetical protein